MDNTQENNSKIYEIDYEKLNQLKENEKKMVEISKELLHCVSSISVFDVNMLHISSNLKEFASEITNLSESNMAVIEETTSNMISVSSTVDNTIITLQELINEFKAVIAKNTQSLELLNEVNKLKNEVVDDINDTNSKINNLTRLASNVEKVVNSVEEIAMQCNLLAINAAIEAARAGVAGKGFSVVAEEVRKLSTDTKNNLTGMHELVSEIFKATTESKESMNESLKASNEMDSKISPLIENIKENVNIINELSDDVNSMYSNIESISYASEEVKKAMESSSLDSQRLNEMTEHLRADASKSYEFAHSISDIDDELSSIIERLFDRINGGDNAIKNKDVINVIFKAIDAHKDWVKTVGKAVKEMQIYPVQTNSDKCAFGHYYQTLKITHPLIQEDWKKIHEIHHTFHEFGKEIMKNIKDGDESSANLHFREVSSLSDEMISILNSVEKKIENMSKDGNEIFGK